MRQLPLGVRLHDRARFDSFHAGPNAAVLERLGQLAARPAAGLAWLHGPAGSGKSHLLQALCAAAGPEAAYLPLLELASLGPAALGAWPAARWTCVDDLGLVAGHPGWERALFALHRDCEERGATLVMAARAPPRELPFDLPDLASRLAAGALLGLAPLDEAAQGAVLQQRARSRGLELPEDTLQFLQRRLPRELASLLAVLEGLDEAALAGQRRLTVPFVRGQLGTLAAPVTRAFEVRGRVQGVWFRRCTADRAAALGLAGEAVNRADGSVHVLAHGPAAPVAELAAWLWVGSPGAQVESVRELPAGPGAPAPGFRTA